MVLECAHVPITVCTPEVAARTVVELAEAGPVTGIDVHLVGMHGVAIADKDPEFMAMLRRAAFNFPDGKSVVWANQLRYRGRGVPGDRVYGPGLFPAVVELGQAVGLRHYLLGSTPAVLAQLEANLLRRFPAALIVGSESPPFRPLTTDEREAQDERIRASGAQLVWVSLSTPGHDWEAARLAATMPVIALAVGAAFDFLAGTKKQAPAWMGRNGLEWIYRLVSEPRRLWRRYLFGNLRFAKALVTRR